jgi:hypothetical protein
VASWRESFPPGIVAGDLPRGALASLIGGSHAQKTSSREAPTRPIRALHERTGTWLPAFLLGSKKRQRYLGRDECEPIFAAGPQNDIEGATGSAGGDALTTHLLDWLDLNN